MYTTKKFMLVVILLLKISKYSIFCLSKKIMFVGKQKNKLKKYFSIILRMRISLSNDVDINLF